MPTKKIHDILTGEVIEREMTPEELAQHEADIADAQAQAQAQAEALAARQAVLARLGLTEEEARLLLGGNL